MAAVDKPRLVWTATDCPQGGSSEPVVIHRRGLVIHGFSPNFPQPWFLWVTLPYPQSYPQTVDSNGDKDAGNGQETLGAHLWTTLVDRGTSIGVPQDNPRVAQ